MNLKYLINISCFFILFLAASSQAQFVFVKSIIDSNYLNNNTEDIRGGDFDKDGLIDLVATAPDYAQTGDERIFLYYNKGDGTYTRTLLDSTTWGAGRIDVGDVDDNGYLDIVIATGDEIVLYRTSDGYTWTKSQVDASLSAYRIPIISDLDKDNDKDVVFIANNGIFWCENDGSENFSRNDIEYDLGVISITDFALQVWDLDKDGFNDVMSVIYTGATELSTLGWYKNDGSQNFTFKPIITNGNYFSKLDIEDLDKDGDIDMLTAEVRDPPDALNAIYWYENDGNQNFSKKTIGTDFSVYPEDLAEFDFDNDGNKDIMATGGNGAVGELVIYSNNGFQDFTKSVLEGGINTGNRQNLYVVDHDKDGDMDAFVMNNWPAQLEYFRNDTPTPAERDSLALVALYNSTNGDGWTTKTNWLTKQPLSTWYGVSVENGRVTGIDLGSNNVTGVLPDAIGDLNALKVFRFFNNSLSGSIPSTIGNLSKLEDLYLSSNNLNGSLPAELGNLDSLQSLNIGSNDFTGPLPAELGQLENLFSIIIPNCNLSGELPASLGNLSNLRWLRISRNQLTGNIPVEIATLPKLEQISLGDNQLDGQIPVELFESSLLNEVDLGNNFFTGTIPNEISNMTSLVTLILEGNNLSGVLPAAMGSLSNVQWMYLNNNQFWEIVPIEFQSLSALQDLRINDNRLNVLPDLSLLPNLSSLSIQNNNFTFEDVEPNLGISTFIYAPQDSVGERIDTTVAAGENLVLTIEIGGSSNQYQWYKDISAIDGATENTLSISQVEINDAGIYHCQITNTLATDLTLISRPANVIVPAPPSATTAMANNLSTTSARLNGNVNPNGLLSNIEFLWGLNSDLSGGTVTTANPQQISGNKSTHVSLDLTDLMADTTYFFQVIATNSLGSSSGSIESFRTLPAGSAPTVITEDPSSITMTSAQFNATANPNGLETAVEFEVQGLSTIAAVENPITGTTAQSVTATMTGLDANTDYQVRANATNVSGTTNGNWVGFKTLAPGSGISAVTLEPLSITYSSVTLRGSVNPDNLNPKIFFQWGADQSYGNIITASPNQISGTNDEEVTAELDLLDQHTTYHYRVIAVNGSDTTYGQNQSFQTLFGPVNLESPQDASYDFAINGSLSWTAVDGASLYRIQVATNELFNNPEINDAIEPNSYEVSLSFNTMYYWRVAVVEAGFIQTWSDTLTFTTTSFPNQVNVATTITFQSKGKASDFISTDYRLFGLPGNADVPIADILGSYADGKWIAWWDNGENGTPENYLESYAENNTFKFQTGIAFWIIYNGSLQINQYLKNAPLYDGNEIAIPVHSGWNMITNPLPDMVDWTIVQVRNGISEPLYNFEGSFSSTSSMGTYKGYYFLNHPDNIVSNIMIPVAAALGKLSKAKATHTLSWQSAAEIKTDDGILSSVEFGISELADFNLDVFDYHKPRAFADIPDIYFDRPQWDDKFSAFASDIKNKITDVNEWPFEVNSGDRQHIELTIKQIDMIPAEYDVFLIDYTRQKFNDMRMVNNYTFKGHPTISSFNLLVGNKNLIREKVAEILPTDFAVGMGYPNPFNPRITFPVSVPVISKIKIIIYDITGKRIKQLFNGTLEPGKHFFTWPGLDDQGNKMASGMYLAHFKIDNDKVYTRKLILIK